MLLEGMPPRLCKICFEVYSCSGDDADFVFLSYRVPPPHLSPFVDNDEEGHMPDYAVTIKAYQAAGQNQVMPLPGLGDEDLDNSLVEAKSEHNEFSKKKREVSFFPFQHMTLVLLIYFCISMHSV